MEELVYESTIVSFLDGPDHGQVANAVHSSSGAKQFGYKKALVGGVTVYSWCVSSILKILGEQWLDFGYIEFHLKRPIFPEEKLTIRLFKISSNQIRVQLSNDSGKPCLEGVAGLGEAPWLKEISITSLGNASAVSPKDKPRLTLENAPNYKPFQQSLAFTISKSRSQSYIKRFTQDAENPIWDQTQAIHPGWIAGQMTWLLEQNYLHLPAIHTRSRIQHLKRLTYEKPITLVGQFVRAYEQKGNHYAELDGSMYSGNELCTQMKHTTIFKIKPKL